jgi:hypothetical protein
MTRSPIFISSCTLTPSYFFSRSYTGTCGMTTFSRASLNNGAGGRSSANIRKGTFCTRSTSEAFAAPVPESVVTSSSPCRALVMAEGRFLLPCVNPACSWSASQEKNSAGSPWRSIKKRRPEAATAACMNSWGETWPLKARRFHALRSSSPNRRTCAAFCFLFFFQFFGFY